MQQHISSVSLINHRKLQVRAITVTEYLT